MGLARGVVPSFDGGGTLLLVWLELSCRFEATPNELNSTHKCPDDVESTLGDKRQAGCVTIIALSRHSVEPRLSYVQLLEF